MISLSAKPADKVTKILNTYDLIAIRPVASEDKKVENIWEAAFTKSDADIISVDLSKKMNFWINKTWVKTALEKCIHIELTYGADCLEGSQANRKIFFTNAMNLIKLTKGGKGIVMSSQASQALFQRSPVDVISMAQMLGIGNPTMAMATVHDHAARCFKHAHIRKTYKGVAELVAVKPEEN
jgi:ribonuclease P/MRP protein subunit RPP1